MTGGGEKPAGLVVRERLDQRLADLGLVRSRSHALDLIRRGLVSVDGVVVIKPAQKVATSANIALSPEATTYVSRGGEKLAFALDHFGVSVETRSCLDIGASTGGFTDVLLRRGAWLVYCVDVGHGQLAPSIAGDKRVRNLGGTDARRLAGMEFGHNIGLIVADVSFISLTLVLPAAMKHASSGADLIALIKPQFELTPADIGKGGLVTDPVARQRAVERVTRFLDAVPGWSVREAVPSPITGGDGNVEYLIAASFWPNG